MSFLIRWIHVAAMALLLGGATLLWGAALGSRAEEEQRRLFWLRATAERYEFLFWAGLGILVVTGVGNLGAFGSGLPVPNTSYGMKLILKLLAVLAFILFSLVRTLLVMGISSRANDAAHNPLKLLQRLYLASILFPALILFLAVSLAHG